MSPMVCMYVKMASSGVKMMNQANKVIRQRTAVDILNAALVLIKMESSCFECLKADAWKKEVWSKKKPLTPQGLKTMEVWKCSLRSVTLFSIA